MIFLTIPDFKKQIRGSVLDQITETDTGIISAAELATLAEIESYLAPRFDMAAIWAATGTSRNALLVLYGVDILLYHIHSRISPSQIPELRIKRYDDAIEWLKLVAKGLLSPSLPARPALPDTENQSKFMIGSGRRRRL